MEGRIIKIEAKVVNPYADSPDVVGTQVTVQHDVFVGSDRHRITSSVFLPPNSVVPLIGDDVGTGIIGAGEMTALTVGDDIELPSDSD